MPAADKTTLQFPLLRNALVPIRFRTKEGLQRCLTLMKACVVFDTRYGNTEKIARSFEAGLQQAGIVTVCVNAKDLILDDSLAQYDMVCIGAPTEWHSASKPMKAFLRNLKGINLSGKYGFAFDTRFAAPLSGSAAKLIEKELRDRGILMIASRESAIVAGAKGGAMLLKEGEEERFKEVGVRVGTALKAKGS
jgi:flavodoxin